MRRRRCMFYKCTIWWSGLAVSNTMPSPYVLGLSVVVDTFLLLWRYIRQQATVHATIDVVWVACNNYTAHGKETRCWGKFYLHGLSGAWVPVGGQCEWVRLTPQSCKLRGRRPPSCCDAAMSRLLRCRASWCVRCRVKMFITQGMLYCENEMPNLK